MDEVKGYFFADAIGDALVVFRKNIGAILINIMLYVLINAGGQLIAEQIYQNWIKILISIMTAILNSSLSISLIVIALNELKIEDIEEKWSIGLAIKKCTLPYYITALIVGIIIGVISLVISLAVVGILMEINMYWGGIASSILIVGIGLYFTIKYAFYPQLVVLKGRYYADALNVSEKLTGGRKVTILGIALFPVLFTVAPAYVISESGLWVPSILALFLLIGAFIHVYSNLAMTALFLNVDYDKVLTTEESL